MSLRRIGLVLGALVALMAMAGSWSADPVLVSLWYFPAALLLTGLAYESIIVGRARVSVQVDGAQRWFLGRPGAVRFAFRHELHRSLVVEFAPAAPATLVIDGTIHAITLPAGPGAAVEFSATPRRLGTYQWPSIRSRIAGPFGLAWWSKQLAVNFELRVQPDLLRSDPALTGVGAAGTRAGLEPGAGGEIIQLRPFRDGDSPRIIDWKATARARQLISRDFAEDQHLEIVIALDAGRASGLRSGALERFGHYVNAAARLAQYAVLQNDLVGLVIFADRPLLAVAPARGAAAVTRLRSILTAAHVEPVESNPLQAALRIRSLVRRRCLVIFLTDLDDAGTAGQLAGATRLLLPKHLPVVAGLSSAAAEALADAPAQRTVDPYQALAAQEYCVGLERNVRALRQLGAAALVAKPQQLERAVFDAYARLRRMRRV